MEWAAWVGLEGRARRADPVPADRRPQARARRLRVTRRAGAAGQHRRGAHRPRGVLPDAEPDADGRGAAARRLGARRADDPARLAARPGEGPPRPRLPRAPGQAGALALASAGRRCPASQPNYVGIDGVLEGLCPPYVTDMDAAVDQVLEEKFGAAAYADPEVFGQSYRDRASAEAYLQRRRRATRRRRSSTRRRSAATSWRRTGASRRTPTPSTCPASGCSSRTWRSSTTSASRHPGHARRAAEGREIWDRR